VDFEDRTGKGLSWWRVLLIGGLLWIASVVVTGVTGNFNLVPTVVLLGSFLVPVAAVAWYLDHYESPTLRGRVVFNGFVIGGVLGVLGASLFEAWLVGRGPLFFLFVGLIEEAAKLLALVIVAWSVPRGSVRDGVVLGAAVGFGFAALESSGYALAALFSGAGGHLSLVALVETELLRGVIAPLGHGLWTAIIGGVLFATTPGRHFRITWRLVATYVGVSVLHALWDSMRTIALVLTVIVTSTSLPTVTTPEGTVIQPTSQQMHVFTVIDLAGYAVIAVIGFLWLVRLWRNSGQTTAPVISRRELA
jgi:RsiW-degrading membrane proteinase PrsW (M82 family)